jgi:hypothetical protein
MYNYGYRDYAPQLARFTTVDPVKDGSNWYTYVRNDPVNLVDPLGLEANAVGGGVVIEPSANPIREDGTVDQLEFERRYGYDDDGPVACNTAAICNVHVARAENDLTLEVLDRTVREWQTPQPAWNGHVLTPIAGDGSPHDANLMARILARNLGMRDYAGRIYDPTNDWSQVTLAPDEFRASDYSYGIEHRQYVESLDEEIVYDHYTASVPHGEGRRTIDSLDWERDAASRYEVRSVTPLQWLPVER